jgi:hypothetical protein
VTGIAQHPVPCGEAMADQARRWLEGLDEHQRAHAVFPFPADQERTSWFYVPTDHGGLALADCTPSSRPRCGCWPPGSVPPGMPPRPPSWATS